MEDNNSFEVKTSEERKFLLYQKNDALQLKDAVSLFDSTRVLGLWILNSIEGT